MTSFSGEYECRLDPKGRMLVPTRLKALFPADMPPTLSLQRGFGQYLSLYTLPEWQKVLAKIESLNEFNEAHRTLQRTLLRGSMDVELDSMGRVLIPKRMQEYAQLEKEVIVVGAATRIEIWNPTLYEREMNRSQEEISTLAEQHLGKDVVGHKDRELRIKIE